MQARDIELRRAREADIPQLVHIYTHTRATCLPYLPRLHDDAEHRHWLSRFVHGDGELWVAPRPEPIAFCALRGDWLEHLYVLPEAQGAGVGALLLELAMRRRRRLSLWVFQKNVRAMRFYEAHGCVLVKLTDGSTNEEREPDALYGWNVNTA